MSSILDRVRDYNERLKNYYDQLSRASKISLWLWVIVNWILLFLIIYIGPSNLFEIFAKFADKLAATPLGWLFLLALIVVTSVPPVMGYGTLITICGFAYGLRGWFVAASGCMLGAFFSFVACRKFLRKYFKDWLQSNAIFNGLQKAIAVKGLPLVVLIRFCPLSFPYSNLFFASLAEQVSLFQFLLATATITPKLFLHVWIGERIYQMADPTKRASMDSTTKLVNYCYIVFGSLVGLGTGWYVYHLTMSYVNQIQLTEEDIEASHRFEDGRLSDLEDEIHTDHDDPNNMSNAELDRQLRNEGILVSADSEALSKEELDAWGDDQFSEFGDDALAETEREDDDGGVTPRAEERHVHF